MPRAGFFAIAFFLPEDFVFEAVCFFLGAVLFVARFFRRVFFTALPFLAAGFLNRAFFFLVFLLGIYAQSTTGNSLLPRAGITNRSCMDTFVETATIHGDQGISELVVEDLTLVNLFRGQAKRRRPGQFRTTLGRSCCLTCRLNQSVPSSDATSIKRLTGRPTL
ncbi:MAG: hypothetical protein JWQ87_1427 [Candidatus Sulfotelmatobacter sp.]|nr:hypothetical protein [Candidatus Sulfotelmatobacter sp.]